MRILMLGWELPPHNSGGLGVACYHMARALVSQGADIEFMVPYEAEHNIDFMKVISTTTASPLEVHTGAYAGRCLSCKKEDDCDHAPEAGIRAIQARYKKKVREHVSTNQLPDVIHAHDWLTYEAGVEAKRLTGRPLIAHVHATEFDRAGGNSGNPLIHEIEYHGLMMADRIFAVSNATKQLIIDKYKIPADKIAVVHNTIDVNDLERFTRDEASYRYIDSLKKEGYTVVSTLGRLTLQKGLTYFMNAAARACQKYDKFVFVVAGDGELREELIGMSADLGIADKVLFTGFVRGKQWRDIYELTDIFVMSSVSEPFGLTALEAAAHDSAIVLTHQSGVSEVMSHTFKYDYWDTDRLSDILINLATEQSLSETLIENTRNEFQHMSWQKVAEHCERQYQLAGVAV